MEESKLYEAPMIEVIEVVVERGFALSGSGRSSDDTEWESPN